jgi:hypothetical protein
MRKKPLTKLLAISLLAGIASVGYAINGNFHIRRSLFLKLGVVEIWELNPIFCVMHSGCSTYEVKLGKNSYGLAYIAQMHRVYRPEADLFLVWPRDQDSKAFVIHTQSGNVLEIPAGTLKDVAWCVNPSALFLKTTEGVIRLTSQNGKVIQTSLGSSAEAISTYVECPVNY